MAGERAGVQWFVSGVPAQVAVGVEGPWFVLARPLTRCDEPLQLQPADRQPFIRDDLLHVPDVVAEAAEEIAARRRRSFRWCRTCRRVQAPEWFIGAARTCGRCEAAADPLDADWHAGAWVTGGRTRTAAARNPGRGCDAAPGRERGAVHDRMTRR